MNDPAESKKVLDLCDAALALAPAERRAYLQALAERSPELALSVRQLLSAVEESGSFLAIDERPTRSDAD
ncbi:hypothetical protein [Woeseia oceani]|uniref:Uncharacterized protein n=1 Tax=Woeseia oceani TaxID=1548547 RepID=A0A193LJV4_9GAMM|nr:hypothetical protein [Woeseia oceani]ANO52679.1 hypothetical protein BA177_17110 [Woeseia oceani]